jgi:protein-S-isoprenylcysteine O-methyltransferase Ste14
MLGPWKMAALTGLLVYALYASFTAIGGGVWTPRHVIALAIMVPSYCLWVLARHQLGTSFALRPEARRLVTRGLYSRIRNPIYLFGTLFNVGLFAFIGIPYLFLLFIVLVPLQIWRAKREQQVLASAFGETYRAYKRQTWF